MGGFSSIANILQYKTFMTEAFQCLGQDEANSPSEERYKIVLIFCFDLHWEDIQKIAVQES